MSQRNSQGSTGEGDQRYLERVGRIAKIAWAMEKERAINPLKVIDGKVEQFLTFTTTCAVPRDLLVAIVRLRISLELHTKLAVCHYLSRNCVGQVQTRPLAF